MKIAKKEGYAFFAQIFLETADQELQHGTWFYTMLQQFKKEKPFDDMKVLPDALHYINRKKKLKKEKFQLNMLFKAW